MSYNSIFDRFELVQFVKYVIKKITILFFFASVKVVITNEHIISKIEF